MLIKAFTKKDVERRLKAMINLRKTLGLGTWRHLRLPKE